MTTSLQDRFGRTIDYLRVSVTDRCDLRCSYCIPKGFRDFEEPDNWLTFDEVERVIAAFARMGTTRFRLTGGEPLLRRNLPELAARIAALPHVEDLSLTTNGTQLVKHAQALRDAGVDRLNVSLDSLRGECVQQITGSDSLEKVLNGLQAAKQAGFTRIKINMVPMIGVNDIDLDAMVTFCMDNDFVLRLIEAMPMGHTGRETQGLSLTDLTWELQQKYGLIPSDVKLGGGPARWSRWRTTAAARGRIMWTATPAATSASTPAPSPNSTCRTCGRRSAAARATCAGRPSPTAPATACTSPSPSRSS